MLPFFLGFITLIIIVLGIFLYTKKHRIQNDCNQQPINYVSDRIKVTGTKAAMVITINNCYEFVAQDGKIVYSKNIKTGEGTVYDTSKDYSDSEVT